MWTTLKIISLNQRSQAKKRVYMVSSHLFKVLEVGNYSVVTEHISGCLGPWVGGRVGGRVSRYKKETFSVNGEFIILIVLIVSWVHAYIKTYQSSHFKHVNHISIKLGGKTTLSIIM